jgi:hypothetical protein
MLAVLQDAIHCFQSTAADIEKSERARFADAEVWLFEENREGPFSFESACDALGLAAPYLRSGLRRWRDQRLAGQSAANRIGRHAPVISVGRITMHSTTPVAGHLHVSTGWQFIDMSKQISRARVSGWLHSLAVDEKSGPYPKLPPQCRHQCWQPALVGM